ncbi:hypothetical protein K6Y31_08170 [Motilimonas cestriensis]|uniref:Uncharacterized protein n=1 Tax=Motilimonas cestriensis TaxID=2742685 RepID=A0ABS8WB18_9GAMM|nr:hypothetical protein [Motilimonas cestriensis]MCE2594791.1 hypothetical protein [Motilimonas cestriensis]
MYITVKNCIPEDYKNNLSKLEAVDRILEFHGKRLHVVYSPKTMLLSILKSSLYGERQKKYASDLLENKREIGSVKNNINLKFVFDFDCESEDVFVSDEFGVKTVYLSYSYASCPSISHGVFLLCEDLSDCHFYRFTGELYAYKNIGRSVKTKFNFIDGGGSRTYKKYKKIFDCKEFALCIVDSDKAHPKGAEGDTSKSFSPFRGHRGFAKNQECIVADFHEVECLIPEVLLQDVLPNKIDAIDEIRNLDKFSNYEFRKYFDHKNGLKLSEALSLDNMYKSNFWSNVFSSYDLVNSKPCWKEKICINNEKSKECNSCIKIDGLGEHSLVKSIEYLERTNLCDFQKNFSPYIKEQWSILGKSVFSWGCVIGLPKARAT